MANFQIGDVITFRYSSKRATDPNPTVFVLHTNWQGMIHGLNFNYLTQVEVDVFRSLVNKKFGKEMKKKNAFIKRRIQQHEEVAGEKRGLKKLFGKKQDAGKMLAQNPQQFYMKYVRPFIQPRGWDPYRLYRPDRMGTVHLKTTNRVFVDLPSQFFKEYVDTFAARRGPRFTK